MSPTWEVDNPGVKETSSCATPSGWSTQLRIWFPDVPRPTAISRAIWAGFSWVKSVLYAAQGEYGDQEVYRQYGIGEPAVARHLFESFGQCQLSPGDTARPLSRL